MKIDEIGSFLAQRRKSLKVCQRDLAALSGVSEHALVNLERGIGNPTLKLVNAVADALGLELNLSVKDQEAT
ncbi:MAG: helix-turn-helix domain-containing protein [Kiritimatiellae bacterium]|nr:helix-turn-helix domain-containing protein [Kiritimatiellia bacterium]